MAARSTVDGEKKVFVDGKWVNASDVDIIHNACGKRIEECTCPDAKVKMVEHGEHDWDMSHESTSKVGQQIDDLARFIMAEIPGEPSRDEGAVECAIRIMKKKNPSQPLIIGAVARGYCHDKNTNKQMDSDLAEAIAEEILTLLSRS